MDIPLAVSYGNEIKAYDSPLWPNEKKTIHNSVLEAKSHL